MPFANRTSMLAALGQVPTSGAQSGAVNTFIKSLETAITEPWTAFTSTMTPGAGTITSQASTSAFLQIGKLVFFRISVQVTNIGTASGTMSVSIPVASKSGWSTYFRENAVNGTPFAFLVSGGSSAALILTQGNANPTWVNNFIVQLTGTYEAA